MLLWIFCVALLTCSGLAMLLALQWNCWRFVWQLNGIVGLVQQPLIWFLLLFYISPKSLLEMTARWRKFFRCPIAAVVGGRIFLYVDDPETVEQVLTSHECLDKTFLQDGFFARKGLLHARGQQWKIRRKQLNPAFSQSILLNFFHIFNSVGDKMQFAFAENMQGANVHYKDVEDLLSRAVLEVSCLTTLGAETNFTQDDALGITRAYKKLLKISALRVMKPWLQCEGLFRLLDRSNYDEYVVCNKLVQQFVEDIVQSKREDWNEAEISLAKKRQGKTTEKCSRHGMDHDGDANGDGDGYGDGNADLGHYNETDEEEKMQKRIFIEQIFHLAASDELTPEDVLNETHAMILVSFETISNSLIIALLLLAMHPDCQRKLRNEIKANQLSLEFVSAGTDNAESYNGNVAQLQQMKYLDMIVNESLRLLTTVPINLRHVSRDFHLRLHQHQQPKQHQQQQQQQQQQRTMPNLIVVPRNTIVVVDTFNMQRDSKHWGPEALDFAPTAHFGSTGASNATAVATGRRHLYSFIPFSKGLRACIGSRYSMLLLKIFLVKLISRFEFRTQTKLTQLRFVQEISLKFQNSDSITFQIRQLEDFE